MGQGWGACPPDRPAFPQRARTERARTERAFPEGASAVTRGQAHRLAKWSERGRRCWSGRGGVGPLSRCAGGALLTPQWRL